MKKKKENKIKTLYFKKKNLRKIIEKLLKIETKKKTTTRTTKLKHFLYFQEIYFSIYI